MIQSNPSPVAGAGAAAGAAAGAVAGAVAAGAAAGASAGAVASAMGNCRWDLGQLLDLADFLEALMMNFKHFVARCVCFF